MSTLSLFESGNGAEFSEDRRHRKKLWRIWDESKPLIMFIGLNPSTANENDPDPTIRRVIDFARRWGYGGVYMMNLFTFVTPCPDQLCTDDNAGENYNNLLAVSSKCCCVLFAWGQFNTLGRDNIVKQMFPNALCLGKNKNGTPKHPLYMKAQTRPILFQ